MPVVILQHVSFEGPGALVPWLEASGHSWSLVRLFAGDPLPNPAGVTHVVVLGGPMGTRDEEDYPWLAAEKAFLRSVLGRGSSVLGICLGAQLLAEALGARVYANPVKEVGWLPVEGCPVDGEVPLGLPPSFGAFHWHGDTFDLPAGAVRLASTPGCVNQAFWSAPRCWGLQFHLEVTPSSVQALVASGQADLAPGPWVQTQQQILGAPPAAYEELEPLLDRVLSALMA